MKIVLAAKSSAGKVLRTKDFGGPKAFRCVYVPKPIAGEPKFTAVDKRLGLDSIGAGVHEFYGDDKAKIIGQLLKAQKRLREWLKPRRKTMKARGSFSAEERIKIATTGIKALGEAAKWFKALKD